MLRRVASRKIVTDQALRFVCSDNPMHRRGGRLVAWITESDRSMIEAVAYAARATGACRSIVARDVLGKLVEVAFSYQDGGFFVDFCLVSSHSRMFEI